jgi:nucleoside-diphosphate-sugar epimerase
VLALATSLGAETFNYVSTAYVSGRKTGVIPEHAVADVEPNNCYEASKQKAERLVLATRGPCIRVLRPSVVVGHSRTLAATTFSGYYGFIRQLVQFRGMVERVQKGLLERTPVKLRLDPDGPINVVPVDTVAREAVAIAASASSEGVYHLTHPSPPQIGMATRTVFAMLGLHEPIFVRDTSELGWLDQRLDERMEFYRSYNTSDRRFDRSRADTALGAKRRPHAEYGSADLEALGRWYLARLEQERAALPVAR